MKVNLKKLIESIMNERERLEEDKVSVKKLKKQNPKIIDVIDVFEKELENHSIRGAIALFYYTVRDIEREDMRRETAYNVIKIAKYFEELDKSKKLQGWLKQEGYDLKNKNLYDFFNNIYEPISSGSGVTGFEEFKEILDKIGQFKSKKQREKISKKDTEKVYSDDRFLIIQPKSEAASCYYGKNTKWCISAEDSKNYWNDYVEEGVEVLFIFDKNPILKNFRKVALAYYPGKEIFEIKDELNNDINSKEELSEVYGEDWEKIKDILQKKTNTKFEKEPISIPYERGTIVKYTDEYISDSVDVYKGTNKEKYIEDFKKARGKVLKVNEEDEDFTVKWNYMPDKSSEDFGERNVIGTHKLYYSSGNLYDCELEVVGEQG